MSLLIYIEILVQMVNIWYEWLADAWNLITQTPDKWAIKEERQTLSMRDDSCATHAKRSLRLFFGMWELTAAVKSEAAI